MTDKEAFDTLKQYGQEQMQRSGPQLSEPQGWVSHPTGPLNLQTGQSQWHPSWLHIQNMSIIAAGLAMRSTPPPGLEPSDEAISQRAARIYKLIMFHARDL